MARIAAAVPKASPDLIYQAGPVAIDGVRFLVTDRGGTMLPLCVGAFRTLLLLAVTYPDMTSRADIARVVQKRRSAEPGKMGADQYIAQLRKCLPPGEGGLPMIENVCELGWRLTTPVTASPRVRRACRNCLR